MLSNKGKDAKKNPNYTPRQVSEHSASQLAGFGAAYLQTG